MAKSEQMLRLMYISKYLQTRNDGANYPEISKHLEEKFNQDGRDLSFAPKTFQRDRKTLNELFNIEIEYKNSTQKYHLVNEGFSELTESVFENLLLVNAYRQTEDNQNIFLFEKRQASGLYHVQYIIHAIKKSQVLSFTYTKHWDKSGEKKIIEPYALKEFRNRWYLIGHEFGKTDFKLKIYGLDRITNLEINSKKFNKKEIKTDASFKNSFGIVSTENELPENIILSFKARQSKFVKSLPLHHSQEILTDNDDELRISLQLVPTYDFYQELLTHAERLSVISPLKVKNEYLRFLNKAIELNKS